jgi:inorganic pyrophosphatase
MSDLSKLPARKDGATLVVVESPRGSLVKLKYAPDLGEFTLSRPLALGLAYPFDWGFVPSTRGPDGDPVDALVVWDVPSFPGVVLACRIIGVVAVEQKKRDGKGRQRNDRVLAIPEGAPREMTKKAQDLPGRVKDEICQFFLASTALEGKDARILGIEGPEVAEELLRASMEEGREAA